MSNKGPTSEVSLYVWQIRVLSDAHLDFWIKDYFEVLAVNHKEDGSSTLVGELPDMPAVYGLIIKLRDMNIMVLSLQVERVKKPAIKVGKGPIKWEEDPCEQ